MKKNPKPLSLWTKYQYITLSGNYRFVGILRPINSRFTIYKFGCTCANLSAACMCQNHGRHKHKHKHVNESRIPSIPWVIANRFNCHWWTACNNCTKMKFILAFGSVQKGGMPLVKKECLRSEYWRFDERQWFMRSKGKTMFCVLSMLVRAIANLVQSIAFG